MQNRIGRKVVIAVVGLALAAGGGLAYAATQNSPADQQQELLNNAAKRLNVSPSDLESALQGAFGDQLDNAVKSGRLTQAQADQIKQRLKEKGGLPLFGPGGPGGPGHFERHGPGGPFGGLDAAAKYLGVTEAKLHQQLEAGKSLADVAKAEGKSVDGLEQAIKDSAKAHLDDAVKAKRLTQAQADRILKDLDSRVGDLVAGKRPDHPGFRGHFRGHGPGPGPGMWGPPPPPGSGSSDQGSSNGSSSNGSSGGSSSSTAPGATSAS
jgi:hypothetical protein